MPISKPLRYQILRRDGFACQYCGGRAPDVALTVDHVIPAALGGPDTPDNLTTACRDCNSGKASAPPDAEHVAAVSTKNREWAATMASIAAEEAQRRSIPHWFQQEWDGYSCGPSPDEGQALPLPAGWESSVETWIARGLTRDDITTAMNKAMGRSSVAHTEVFRYMAGICWKTLTEREDEAYRRTGGA